MGNQAMILMVGTLAIVAVFVNTLMKTGGDQERNAIQAFSQTQAREVNNAAIELGLRTIADSSKYRTTMSNLSMFGGKSTITFKDTLFGTDSAVIVRTKSVYKNTSKDSAVMASSVVVRTAGFVPWVVRGALTGFGPLDNTLSDMFVDGRNWNFANTAITPSTGRYAISTGQATYVNNQNASLGGTTIIKVDIPPAFPHNPLVVETGAVWNPAWPTTPDAAMGFTPGTLKQMAITKALPGSQYVTSYTQLVFPLKGITYIEVPNGTVFSRKNLGTNPQGILVFHSPACDAFWNNVTVVANQPFKGLMLFDRVFHIHMDILGALVMLSPNTINNRNCGGNANHKIRYSEEAIKMATGGGSGTSASWKDRLRVLSWYE